MRTQHTFIINAPNFKQQLLKWSQQFEEVVWLDSNNYLDKYGHYDVVLAVDAITCISTDYHNSFRRLEEYQTSTQDWIFGYLGYDLKNDQEKLNSENFDGLKFPDLFFFQPKKIITIKGNRVEMNYMLMVADDFELDKKTIKKLLVDDENAIPNKINLQLRLTKERYIEKVEKMLFHIKRGDIYEANFCQEFFAENCKIDPLATYQNLNAISKPPFASFFKNSQHFALSASPERYLKKIDNVVISQPIKGTAKRSTSVGIDEQLKDSLKIDQKERSENIMIVDLVRNDLSRIAEKGSVKVEELCEVYTFSQVHHMISTVTAEIGKDTTPVTVLKNTFPMGSMTGAPKVSAMKIIEELEETKRGLYSGTIGYINPRGDFDFNVVIRSILYNAQNHYVSVSVGSAITARSKPEKEYEECLIKVKAMLEVLGNQPILRCRHE